MEMLNKTKTEDLAQSDRIIRRVGKRPYSSPKLELYGSVRTLTSAGISVLVENGNPGNCSQNNRMTCLSDRRLKENLVLIGTHPLGIGLYLFDYKPEFRDQWGHARRLGVMADEVETVRPEAVVVHADGYKMVDYGMLN